MSLFLPNIPQSGDPLDFSQGQLLSNNQGLDTVFGIEHYKFSDASSNKGFHNSVTTPGYNNPAGTIAAVPPVTTVDPIFYGFQPLTAPNGTPTTSLGLLQYSAPTPNNATTNPYGSNVPTPLTHVQSPATGLNIGAGSTSDILDFSGLSFAMAILYGGDTVILANSAFMNFIFWNGTNFKFSPVVVSGIFAIQNNGNILQIKNTAGGPVTSTFWSLDLLRVS